MSKKQSMAAERSERAGQHRAFAVVAHGRPVRIEADELMIELESGGQVVVSLTKNVDHPGALEISEPAGSEGQFRLLFGASNVLHLCVEYPRSQRRYKAPKRRSRSAS